MKIRVGVPFMAASLGADAPPCDDVVGCCCVDATVGGGGPMWMPAWRVCGIIGGDSGGICGIGGGGGDSGGICGGDSGGDVRCCRSNSDACSSDGGADDGLTE